MSNIVLSIFLPDNWSCLLMRKCDVKHHNLIQLIIHVNETIWCQTSSSAYSSENWSFLSMSTYELEMHTLFLGGAFIFAPCMELCKYSWASWKQKGHTMVQYCGIIYYYTLCIMYHEIYIYTIFLYKKNIYTIFQTQ